MKIEQKGVDLKMPDTSELNTISEIEAAELSLKMVYDTYTLCLKQIELAKERLDGKSMSELNQENTNENVDSTEEEQDNKIMLSHANENKTTEMESYKIQRKKKNQSEIAVTTVNVSPTKLITEQNDCNNNSPESTVDGQSKKTGIDAYVIRRQQKIQSKVADPKVSPTTSNTEQDNRGSYDGNVLQKQIFSSNMNVELVDPNKSSPNNAIDNTVVATSVTNVRIYQTLKIIFIYPSIY